MSSFKKVNVPKTGYKDIDKILDDLNNLRLQSEKLQKEINNALKFKPVVPKSIKIFLENVER
jgi:hypothetical protein